MNLWQETVPYKAGTTVTRGVAPRLRRVAVPDQPVYPVVSAEWRAARAVGARLAMHTGEIVRVQERGGRVSVQVGSGPLMGLDEAEAAALAYEAPPEPGPEPAPEAAPGRGAVVRRYCLGAVAAILAGWLAAVLGRERGEPHA